MKLLDLFEEDRHSIIDLEEAVDIFIKSCGDINSPLYRVNSNSESITKSKTTKRTISSIAGSGEIFEHLKSLPGWENIPKRTESVFCSTTSAILYPYGNANLIYPFKNCNMATIQASDFNGYKITLGDQALSFSSVQSLITAFDTSEERSFERGAKAVAKISQQKLPENSDELRKIYLAWRMNVTPEWLGTFGKFFDIVRQNIPNDWKPADLNISSLEVKDIPDLHKKRQEVWFTGEYLSVPSHLAGKFKDAVKELL